MPRKDQRDRWTIPALHPRDGSAPARFAARLGSGPVAVFAVALLAAFAVLVALASLLGLLVTDVLVAQLGLGGHDASVVSSLVGERSAGLTEATEVASAIGGAPVLPVIASAVALIAAAARQWVVAAFSVFVLALESATYRAASLLVPRERPDVRRLDDFPADASWPSGHTAASIAVYAGLAVLFTSAVAGRGWKAGAWTLAIVIPVVVAVSRMYRGMHHPTDVVGGILIGIGAIAALLFACRAAGAASAARARAPQPARTRAPQGMEVAR